MKIRRELNRQLYRQKTYGHEKNPYHFDEAVSDAILNGDIEKMERLLSSGAVTFSDRTRTLSKNQVTGWKYHFVIMAASLARSGIDAGLGQSESYMIADLYIQKADRTTDRGDLQMLLEDMCLDYTERINEIQKEKTASVHIRKCITYIYENLNEDLSVKKLAALTSLHVSYLCRLFKRETGKTIKTFVTAAKMDTAQNLLKYSDLSCSEIAASLGYCSQSAFTFAFRQFTGTTPAKYRG